MDYVFHSDIDDTFVEYFLQDLLVNVTQLDELLTALARDTSEKSRKAIFKQIFIVREIINEEIEMLNQLLKFRLLTSAEETIADKIEEIRNSEYILEFEKVR